MGGHPSPSHKGGAGMATRRAQRRRGQAEPAKKGTWECVSFPLKIMLVFAKKTK